MTCKICQIANNSIVERIEHAMLETGGELPAQEIRKLCKDFPELATDLKAINNNDCTLHFNFHQQSTRRIKTFSIASDVKTLAQDVGKDEAELLYEFLNVQMGTLNGVNNALNDALLNRDKDLSAMFVHPTTLDFYRDLGNSIRATARELRELNSSINGSKDSAVEGLKALALALRPESEADNAETMETKEFD